MSHPQSSNRRIAKNTLMLYIRMLISMIVGLYTSRVVLQTLGVEDYGIYGVVGGVVSMMGFLDASMSGATSLKNVAESAADGQKVVKNRKITVRKFLATVATRPSKWVFTPFGRLRRDREDSPLSSHPNATHPNARSCIIMECQITKREHSTNISQV